MSHEELLEEVHQLKLINQQLREQIFEVDLSKFPWLDYLGHWFWDFTHNIVSFNPLKALAIGYEEDEFPKKPGFDFFTNKIHPEDYERVMEEMRAHLKGDTPVWEVKYRIQAKDGSWKTFHDRGKVTQRTKDGKPFYLTGIVFDITKDETQYSNLVEETERWRTQAQYDHLTHLYSRAELEKKVFEFHSISKSHQETYSILMIDLDHFKSINDKNGHQKGDFVLSQIGQVIRQHIRSNDIAGRYGGDEFLIILPNTQKAQAYEIGQRIQDGLRQINLDSLSLLTISGGIASSEESQQLTSLLDLADKRLYAAKKAGRNQIFYQETHD